MHFVSKAFKIDHILWLFLVIIKGDHYENNCLSFSCPFHLWVWGKG